MESALYNTKPILDALFVCATTANVFCSDSGNDAEASLISEKQEKRWVTACLPINIHIFKKAAF